MAVSPNNPLSNNQSRQPMINGADIDLKKTDGLKQAFELFNQMSHQLSDTYTQLEDKIESLSDELADVSAQRMSELKEKERLANQLENLLAILPGGVVVVDGNGNVQRVNPAAERLLTTHEQDAELVGQPWYKIIQTSFKPQQDDGHEVSLHDGRKVSLSTNALGNEPGQIILLIDQTETRLLQDRLAHHQRLSDMGRMVASLAHQIRTPLSSAMLYSSHLKKEGLKDNQRIKFANKIQERLEHLEHQVRDMLLFAKGKAPLNDSLSALQLSNDIKKMSEGIGHGQPVSIVFNEIEEDCQIQCNRDSLLGAVLNLIQNGIEATLPSDVKIKVSFLIDAGMLLISVEDNGPGISQNQKDKVMEPFHTTKSHGTGLGLSVVSAVCHAHYGGFEIKNGQASGVKATIKLPILQSEDLFNSDTSNSKNSISAY